MIVIFYDYMHAIATLFYNLQDANLYSAAQEITSVDNVVHETLRLYPPVPEYVCVCVCVCTCVL